MTTPGPGGTTYDWSEIRITRYVAAPLADVFALWTTAAGLARFWADDVVCTTTAGAVRAETAPFERGDRIALTFTTGAATALEILAIEPDRSLTFDFGEDYGRTHVALTPAGDRTRLDLRHHGLPAGGDKPWPVHAHARGWWIFNLLNADAVLIHGHDLRLRESAAGDALSVGYGTTDRAPHDWTAFDVHLHVGAAPDTVLSHWRSAAGLESFFVREARFTDADGASRSPGDEVQTGDRYRWLAIHDVEMTGEMLAAALDHVAFSFGERYRVDVRAGEHGGGALLHLRQTGLRDDPDDRVHGSLNCRCCWIYFLTVLKARLEHGIDLRDQDPRTADSIAVGFGR